MAVNLRNDLPREFKGRSPLQRFSSLDLTDHHFPKVAHPFGCPVYVLAASLQSGYGKTKWSERSRLGVYLGYSPEHASSVALVLNLQTGHVSPQFHVVFDDDFDTVNADAAFESLWQEKSGLPNMTSDADLEGHDIPPGLHDLWFTSPGRAARHAATQPAPAVAPLPVPEGGTAAMPAPEGAPAPAETAAPEGGPDLPPHEDGADGLQPPDPPPVPAQINPAQAQVNEQIAGDQGTGTIHLPGNTRRSARLANRPPTNYANMTSFDMAAFVSNIQSHGSLPDGTINDMQPLVAYVGSASQGDPDTMHLADARKQPDWPEFEKAMAGEVADFNRRKHWKLVPASSMDRTKPYDIVNAVWSFKRKRTPAGELIKHKARLCAHGGQQTKGVTYTDTYSPVVNWFTLRTLLIFSLLNGWHSRSIDFVLAFPQADIKTNVYMRLPYGFHVTAPGKWFLKLLKNVYGLKDAGRTWHQHLRQGLEDRGFKAGDVDPCVFYKGNLILVIYVDDVIAFSPDPQEISDFVDSMKQEKPQKYVLEDLGDVTSYLGIQVKKTRSGSIHLTQPHLINKIIQSAGFERREIRPVATPAAEVLKKYADSKSDTVKDFHYRSVIGQLNYLANTTRPDIAFAVHQCARFSNDPKDPHVKAVKRIVRYLHGTQDKGLILDPKDPALVMYVDADFAGAYHKDHADEPASVFSRTGSIITYAGCPIYWMSKLQTEIALSSTEAEYIALSQSMRNLLPIQALFKEIHQRGFQLSLPTPEVRCTVFEDNAGAIELANAPKIRPRTKHIAIKYHHFRSHVKTPSNPNGTVTIKYINTRDQQADILTKDLPQAAFEHLRLKIMGW